MRSRIAWLIGLAGLWALVRKRRPRTLAVEPAADPAAELRRKLDETDQQPAAPPEPAAGDLNERRRQVHDSGRAAVDEMSGPATPAE